MSGKLYLTYDVNEWGNILDFGLGTCVPYCHLIDVLVALFRMFIFLCHDEKIVRCSIRWRKR